MKYVILNNNRKLELRIGWGSLGSGCELTDEEYATLAEGGVPNSVEYLSWLANNTPEPPTPDPVFKPAVVSMRQARLALLSAGLLSQVNDSLAGMTGVDGEAARIEWEYATEVRRESSLVAGLSVTLGLTEAKLDDLFLAAYGIQP